MGHLSALLLMKSKVFVNTVRSVGREPPLKTIVVTFFIAIWMCGGFFLFYKGLIFIGEFRGIGDYLIGRLFYLFALAVFLMLIFSSVLLAYPVLYARRENHLLLSMPIPPSSIISCKLWEIIFLSSWAFIIMAAPLLLAYFLAGGLSVKLFFIAWLYFIPLAVMCGSGGLLIALVLGRYLPRYRRWISTVLMIVVLGSAACFIMARYRGDAALVADQSLLFVNQLMTKARFASWFLIPSRWVVDAVFDLARGDYGSAVFLWLLLFSNALFLCSLSGMLGEKLFAAGWDRRMSRPPVPRMVRAVSWTAARSPLGSIAAKDIITFFRDASQWGQFALFFGLLGLYILNLRNLPYELENLFWRYLLFILNLSALGFTLVGLSSRFFFPLISLELKRFWLLGLSPVSAEQIIREKFLLCMSFTVSATGLLALLSGLMLRVSYLLLASSLVSVAFMGIAISALSVGIGAVYPNVRARSSAEIISGLGGTMVLVINLIYILLALFIQGVPLYLHLSGLVSDSFFPLCLLGSTCVLGAVSVGTAVFSLDAGKRRLAVMDL